MATLQSRKYCRTCGQKTLHQKQYFDSALGCLLTILTGGLFLLIWLPMGVVENVRGWRCQTCGTKR